MTRAVASLQQLPARAGPTVQPQPFHAAEAAAAEVTRAVASLQQLPARPGPTVQPQPVHPASAADAEVTRAVATLQQLPTRDEATSGATEAVASLRLPPAREPLAADAVPTDPATRLPPRATERPLASPARRPPPSPVAFAHGVIAGPDDDDVEPRTLPEASLPVGALTADAPEPQTRPSSPNALRALAAQAPEALPSSLRTTDPGTPGPFHRESRETGSAPTLEPTTEPEPAFAAAPAFDAPAAAESGAVYAEPASLWRRAGAWLVDLLCIGGLVLGLLLLASGVIGIRDVPLAQQLGAVALPGALLAGILAFVYTSLFAMLWSGRTVGRRLLGIHLVDATGHAPAPARALVRAGLALGSFALFLAGFWLALFDRHGQTLHDKLTRTFVVRLQDA